jgi:hypothetical protein
LALRWDLKNEHDREVEDNCVSLKQLSSTNAGTSQRSPSDPICEELRANRHRCLHSSPPSDRTPMPRRDATRPELSCRQLIAL